MVRAEPAGGGGSRAAEASDPGSKHWQVRGACSSGQPRGPGGGNRPARRPGAGPPQLFRSYFCVSSLSRRRFVCEDAQELRPVTPRSWSPRRRPFLQKHLDGPETAHTFGDRRHRLSALGGGHGPSSARQAPACRAPRSHLQGAPAGLRSSLRPCPQPPGSLGLTPAWPRGWHASPACRSEPYDSEGPGYLRSAASAVVSWICRSRASPRASSWARSSERASFSPTTLSSASFWSSWSRRLWASCSSRACFSPVA